MKKVGSLISELLFPLNLIYIRVNKWINLKGFKTVKYSFFILFLQCEDVFFGRMGYFCYPPRMCFQDLF